jgi:CheY-like chemotaxis protein
MRRIATTVPAVRIVLCDDDAAVRLLFRTALDQLPCTIVEVASVAECRALLATGEEPELVVLDAILRDGTVLDLLPEVRHRWPVARVLVVSAQEGAGLLADCIAAGADACHDKLDFLPNVEAHVRPLVLS